MQCLARRPRRASLACVGPASARQTYSKEARHEPADGAPPPRLMEVSLNNMLVAKFLRDEAQGGMMIGKCRESTMPVGKGQDTDKRAAPTEKEIAVDLRLFLFRDGHHNSCARGLITNGIPCPRGQSMRPQGHRLGIP